MREKRGLKTSAFFGFTNILHMSQENNYKEMRAQEAVKLEHFSAKLGEEWKSMRGGGCDGEEGNELMAIN